MNVNNTQIQSSNEQKKSLQYDLFSKFISNGLNGVSNTIEFWDSIPKFFFNRTKMKQLRTKTGHADPFVWDYEFYDQAYSVKIQPALIEQKDGTYKAFFPGPTEELVEEALKKIMADQRYGMHDTNNYETWVRFTLNMIAKELKARGRTRSSNEIKHAIQVMNKCVLTVSQDGREIWTGQILQDLVTIGRKTFESDRKDKQHIARMALFISYGINALEFRQFNLDRLMSCDEQLSRWIYRKLINRYVQAAVTNTYKLSYNRVRKESAFLQAKTVADNVRKLKSALDELVKCGVILFYKEERQLKGKKIEEIIFLITPSPDFVSEQKAANMRSSNNIETKKATNLKIISTHGQIVDNS